MRKDAEKKIVGHIGVIRPQVLAHRRRKQQVLSMEEKEKLIAQAKSAYEICISPTSRVSR